jgi:hypothetical protein
MKLLNMRCRDFKNCKGCPFDTPKYEWLCDKTERNNTLAGAIACAEVDLKIQQQSLKDIKEELNLAEYVDEPKEEDKHESVNCN